MLRARGWLLGGALVVVACGVARAPGSSESDHTEGDLIWQNEPYQWAAVDRDAFDRATGQKSVATDNAVSVRLQAWVDRYDQAVRDLVKSKTGKTFVAPKPQVRIVPTKDVNAFIAFEPTCMASAAAGDGGAPPLDAGAIADADSDGADAPDAARSPKAAAGEPFRLVIVTAMGAATNAVDGFGKPVDCFTPGNWPPDQGKAVAWFDKIGATQITPEQGALAISGITHYSQFPSSFEPPDDNTVHARQAGIVAAFPYLNVYPALVAGLSEKATAAVLAHELGHYYRSHMSTANIGQYDFWYDRDQPAAVRPVPVADQASYERKYNEVKAPRFLVTGQKYDPRFAPTLLSWAKDVSTPAGHVCASIQTALAGWSDAVRVDLLGSATRDLTSDDQQAYLDLEKAAGACIDALALTDATSSTKWGDKDAPRAWFLDRLVSPLREAIKRTDFQAATLADLVKALDDKAKAIGADGDAFLASLDANHIGRYTTEQEADDIAMDLSSRLGVTPAEVLDGFIETTRLLEKGDPPAFAEQNDGLSAAQCEALYRANFKAKGKDGKDEEVYVPLGSLYDPHHAWCYRIFNLFRERNVHAYKPGAPNFPPDSPPWAAIQTEAAKLAGVAPPDTVDGGKDAGNDAGSKAHDAGTGTSDGGVRAAKDAGAPDDDNESQPGVDPTTINQPHGTTSTSGCNASASRSDRPFAWGAALLGLAAAVRRRRRRPQP